MNNPNRLPKLPKDDGAQQFGLWASRPTPRNMQYVLDYLQPTINAAVKSYGAGNESALLRNHAKLLAIGAVKSYQPDKGTALKSHVMNQLKPLGRFNAQATQPMKMSERYTSQLYALRQAEKDFYDKNGRDPADAELADHSGISVRQINKLRSWASPVISSTSRTLEGPDPATNFTDPQEILLDYIYHDADPHDKRILDWKLGRGGRQILPNTEIAKRLKMSPAAVTQRAAKLQKRIMDGMAIV